MPQPVAGSSRNRLPALASSEDRKPPTIDDLRVKECYICRDEERFDEPTTREWVHPCKCTLIAHQDCLLEMLSKRPVKRPKCPQCAFEYQMERSMPFLVGSLCLRIGDTVFQAMGMSFIATSAIGMGAFTVASVIAVGTGYGAIAVREYFGAELFDLLLTDEPTNWSIGHYIFLFLTPLRLVTPFVNLGAFTPFFFLWPRTPPISVRQHLAAQSNRVEDAVAFPNPSNALWPPSLQTFGWITIGTSMLYSRFFSRFSEWLLGMKLPEQRGRMFRGLTFRREVRVQEGPDGREQEAVLQVQREAEETDLPIANLAGVTQYSNISNMIGLLKPFVASGMGHLLYLGARRSDTLRFLLGIRFSVNSPPTYPPPKLVPELYDNVWYWKYFTAAAVQQMDPVWIRNSVGLGIFILARDCVHLFHLWLTKQELGSRRLKNRDFAGVDLRELDLINGHLVPSEQAQPS